MYSARSRPYRPQNVADVPMRRVALVNEAYTTIPALVIVIAVLLVAGWAVFDRAKTSAAYQREIRIVQALRARVLRYQLDEETGVRGYTGTGDPWFLEPYRLALPKLSAAFPKLHRALQDLRIDRAVLLEADQERMNNEWLTVVAQPLLADWRFSPATLALQRRGKAIVDRFRGDNAELEERLSHAAAKADEESERSLRILLTFVIAALIAVIASAYALVLARVSGGSHRRVATLLQKALAGNSLPAIPNLTFDAVYSPAAHHLLVGGDWYDVYELPDKRIMFSIGDVGGHGLLAAVIMNRVRQSLLAAALQDDDPAKVLERANRALMLQEPHMVTVIVGFIDPFTRELVYATAGHPPPMLADPGEAPVLLPYDGLPLGVFFDTRYKDFKLTAPPGATLLLYTDGVIEQDRDIIAGLARLLELMRTAMKEPNPARAIEQALFSAVKPVDDVAILAITFDKSAPRVTTAAPVGVMHRVRGDVAAKRRLTDDEVAIEAARSGIGPHDLGQHPIR